MPIYPDPNLPHNPTTDDELENLYKRCDVSNNRTDKPIGFEDFKSALQVLMLKQALELIGEDEFEEGMEGDDKIATKYGDYLKGKMRAAAQKRWGK